MKEYSTEQLQDAFTKLPKELQDAISSAEIHQKIMDIGNEHGLHIDQIGELIDQIGLVMLGLERSSDFVRDASSRLSISTKNAQAIADDINTSIFSAIKASMRAMEDKKAREQREQTMMKSSTPASDARKEMAALEQAGGFSVEPSLASSSADGEEPASDSGNINEADKGDILAGIENPTASPAITAPKIVPKPEEAHIEPLVDHLLGNASGQTEQKIIHKTEEPPVNLPITEEKTATSSPIQPASKPKPQPPRPAPQPRKGPDPYRESFN